MALLNEHLEHQVKQLLVQSEELSSQRIDVRADEGKVTLEGKVQSFRRKLAAQEIAESCEHVSGVVNNLVVSAPESSSDENLALQINRALQHDKRLSDQAVRVDTHAGTVTLSGYTSNLAEKKLVADIAASVDGVREIHNLLVVNKDRVLANRQHAVTVLASIHRIIGMENEQLVVSIVDETARISGVVDSLWKKDSAEQTVRQFGILKVCNDVVVYSPS